MDQIEHTNRQQENQDRDWPRWLLKQTKTNIRQKRARITGSQPSTGVKNQPTIPITYPAVFPIELPQIEKMYWFVYL